MTYKLIINGHAQHGKDYLAAAVSEALGLKRLTASMWFAEKHLMPAFPGKWSCVEEAFEDRHNWRSLWYQMMRVDSPAWQTEFMQHSDVFTGHRNIGEHTSMQSSLKANPQLKVLSVFVMWNGKTYEDPQSCQWQDLELIRDEHDLVLYHSGQGAEGMVYEIKRKLSDG